MTLKILNKTGKVLFPEMDYTPMNIRHEGAPLCSHLKVIPGTGNHVIVQKGKYIIKDTNPNNEPEYRLVELDTNSTLTIPTDSNSATIYAIVIYYDKSVEVADDGSNSIKFKVISGTAESKTPPSETTISNAVNNNPYAILGYVLAPSSTTSNIPTQNIVDMRTFMDLGNSPRKNFVMNSDFSFHRFGHVANNWSLVTLYPGMHKAILDGSSSEARLTYDIFVEDEAEINGGDIMTVSMQVKDLNDGTGSYRMEIHSINSSGGDTTLLTKYFFIPGESAGTDTRKTFATFVVPNDSVKLVIKAIANRKVEVSFVKLEKGNTPTPYSVRPLDKLRTKKTNTILEEDSKGGSDTTFDFNILNDSANIMKHRTVGYFVDAYVGNGADDSTYAFGYEYINGNVRSNYEFKIKATNQGAYRYAQAHKPMYVCNNYLLRFRYRSNTADVLIQWNVLIYYK